MLLSIIHTYWYTVEMFYFAHYKFDKIACDVGHMDLKLMMSQCLDFLWCNAERIMDHCIYRYPRGFVSSTILCIHRFFCIKSHVCVCNMCACTYTNIQNKIHSFLREGTQVVDVMLFWKALRDCFNLCSAEAFLELKNKIKKKKKEIC